MALPFIALPPCRLVDTRGNSAPMTGGFLPSATVRSYTLTGVCNVPANAQAISLNATVVKPVGPGFLVLWPEGGAFPPVSTLNYLGNDVIVNAAVVPLSVSGGISMALGVSGGDVILDTNGYYAATPSVTSLNTLAGDLTLAAGANVSITPSANTLTIASAGAQGPAGPTGPTGPQGPPGPTGWALTGNAGTNPATNFIGTTDNVPLELRVNGVRALRLEQASTIGGPFTYVGTNVVGGSSNNSITTGVSQATIAGGGGTLSGSAEPNMVTDLGGTVGGGASNVAGNNGGTLNDASYATVAGGSLNTASGRFSAVAGGIGNTASGDSSAVAGGNLNTASGGNSAVAGGGGNHASGDSSAVAGGSQNTASGGASAVAGGSQNTASGSYSAVAGVQNTASGYSSAVPGGANNTAGGDFSFAAGRQARVRDAATAGNPTGDQGTFAWADSQAANFFSTGPNQFLIRSAGGVGINKNNPSSALDVAGTIKGTSASANGVEGSSTSPGFGGVYGRALAATGFSVGVRGDTSSPDGIAVWGYSTPTVSTGFPLGVEGRSDSPIGIGVSGFAAAGSGVNIGVRGVTNSPTGWAGYFIGNVHVTGTLSKGGGSFKIDHPLDPENKYLSHSFVESPDMKNIYDGVVTTDEKGYASVDLPEWFEALNRDFRYQLTVLDEADGEGFVQAKVVKGVASNRFALRTSSPNARVSWQVTGIRKDAWAEKNRIPVEETKPESQRGRYLYPELFGRRAVSP